MAETRGDSQKGGRLAGKVAIVTGGSTGIGKGIARNFAAEGASVVICARGKERPEAAAKELAQATGSKVEAVVCDVGDEAQVQALFKRATDLFGRLDILVNNAGSNTRELVVDMPFAKWNDVIRSNLTAVFLTGREALRIMKGQQSGRIINIGSIAAKVPRANSAAYVAAKVGLAGLTRAMALEGRADGIAVSQLNNGNTRTDRWLGRDEQAAKEGIMEIDDVAGIALAMALLPDGVNVLDGTLTAVNMPYIGRG
jgi:NAD(P)-dependent dehydrogenase (short-subunit alcohol dehydrogenase family)